MPLNKKQVIEIKELLSSKIESKLSSYGRETQSMPFLARLIQDSEKIAAYSFIHSMSTTLGMSIYEQVSEIIARPNSDECFRNYSVGGVISPEQKRVINNIIQKLRIKEKPSNISAEKKEVLLASQKYAVSQKFGEIADFYMKRKGKEFYFEIKTVKPNIDVFKASKTKLLEWVARRRKAIYPFLAFPYNPYHPEPYDRFTEVNLVKVGKDCLVGENYWDFLGGKNTYVRLLDIFDCVGKKYKRKLADKFKEIAKTKVDSY